MTHDNMYEVSRCIAWLSHQLANLDSYIIMMTVPAKYVCVSHEPLRRGVPVIDCVMSPLGPSVLASPLYPQTAGAQTVTIQRIHC